ncbi:gamma-glutamyltransferase [Niveispirillum lacus]|uniref:Glutathione hydrolase proenzyme n=2 Tax=Niveispirillum lacus TaxID=1981099 RepID=A0A255Z3E8_9PROT|nr:gamma-glutamyltransferase [Niveispirillum lacus]
MPIITDTAVAADYVDGAQAGRGDRLVGANFAGRSEIIAKNGAAATSQPLATQVAISILQQGGSAVDAAIAANAALGLMEPTGSGVGGDLFALIWDPKQNKVVGLNASGRAPKGQSLEALVKRLGPGKMIPSHGSLSVTVPGAVAGWFEMHQKYGKLPMDKVLAPAIAYANDGFPLSPFIAKGWAANFKRFDQMGSVIEELDNAKKTFLIDGKPPVAGQIFRNPDLANTLTLLARGGQDAFYKGPVAKTIDAYMKRIGGPLRYEDFADFKAEWVEPISTNYRGYDVWQIPPNGQGLATLQMLNILEGYDLKAIGHNSADFIHVSVEAKKLAFADRARWYADQEFVKLPISTLISKDYATKRRAQIDMTKAGAPETGIMPESHDTIFLSTADKDGLMVALIQSNYRGMGSGLVPDGLGFMLQDRGEQFALDPKHPNVYAPGKRPFHTIIPGFVTKDNKPFAAYGVMGGGMQPQGHTQVLVNMIDFGMNVQEAGDAARWQHEGSPEPTGEAGEGVGTLYVEQGVAPAVIEELRKRGHKVEVKPGLHYGSYEAIVRDHVNGVYRAGTEMRVDGHAAGY